MLPINTIIELKIDGNAMAIPPQELPFQSITFKREVTASSQINPRWNPGSSVIDGDWVGHFWKPAADDRSPWIEFDLGIGLKGQQQ